MPRIRSVKPEFFTSESVSALPLRARLTWIGLWTHCDNHGRTRDNVKLIKAAVWPLDSVGLKEIEDDLRTLADHGRIVRYEVEGKRYLAITNWGEHQYSAGKGDPKHPGPEDGTALNPDGSRPDVDESRHDLHEFRHSRNKSRPNQGSCNQGSGDRDQEIPSPNGSARFDEFYAAYPRRQDRADAQKAFNRALKRADADTLIVAAKRYAEACEVAGTEKRFIKLPATWLNKGSWENEPLPLDAGGHQAYRNPTDPKAYEEGL